MKGISVNGKNLHEVRMFTVPYDQGMVSYLSYPKNRIGLMEDHQEIILTIPPLLAIELYRAKILPQDEEKSFPVHVSGKKIGTYRVVDFRYPNSTLTKRCTGQAGGLFSPKRDWLT
jgi:hypothetical protein